MKEIEIPLGAKDSELKGWEYTIPEGMEAEIKDGKIVVREKESEDERIRKDMIEYFTEIIDNICVEEDIKHEEKVLVGRLRKWIAYLEKQKENPKSADSIPSDCVSDAKCEDRWHKVGDSLPDNPREVLCKDEAGNYFIGRYYVGEGWEISNYDDEDKPHHLNPPVSKWIDFPSEKQKEHQNNSDAPNESSWSGIISSSDKDKNLDEIAQDYVDGVTEYNPEPTWDLMQTAVCYGYHYCEQKEQKPEERFEEAREKYQVEWSDNDDQLIGFIFD